MSSGQVHALKQQNTQGQNIQGQHAEEHNVEEQKAEVGIIVVAHGDYGSMTLRTAEIILGPLTDCASISVDVAQEVEETVQRLEDATARLNTGAGVIILTDMFGGTPTNLSLALLAKHNIEVVTGVNLPMVLKVFSARAKPLKELATLAGEAGKSGIVVAGNMLSASATQTAQSGATAQNSASGKNGALGKNGSAGQGGKSGQANHKEK